MLTNWQISFHFTLWTFSSLASFFRKYLLWHSFETLLKVSDSLCYGDQLAHSFDIGCWMDNIWRDFISLAEDIHEIIAIFWWRGQWGLIDNIFMNNKHTIINTMSTCGLATDISTSFLHFIIETESYVCFYWKVILE